MNAAKSVSATFSQVDFTLSASVTGSGSVTSSPSGISCGSTCSANYVAGTQVTLTATPAGGDSFTGWGGACGGTGNCVVTMNAAESVSATFSVVDYNLDVDVFGSGTVTSSPFGINCGSTCSASYPSGTGVTLTAAPASGYIFTGWSDACSGTGSCVVTMSAAETVTATFLQEALTRTFVSSSGIDINPCTIAAPCATFARAYTVTQPKGIVAALDPGKYGPLTITYPITVNGNGWAAITGTAQGSGITINAGSGNVILTGLEVDGAGAAYNGIVFNSGNSLTVSNCIVKDFISANGTSGNGIMIAPTSGPVDFTIVNTTALNNGSAGIHYLPASGSATATGAIDHVIAANNAIGMAVDLSAASAGSAAVTISNSIANNNTSDGILTASAAGTVTVTVDRDEVSSNGTGVAVGANTSVLLSRSVIAKNSTYGISNSGTAGSSEDNRIAGNGSSNIHGTALTDVSQQ
jgi:Divergent InlB B-repeat domain/Periplasmic copper-binding protein (NosD)